jgi:hypothetical protein
MYKYFGAVALALVASGCRATVAPSDDTPKETPKSSSPRLLTADELNALAPGDALRIDLSRSGSAVRFDDSKGPFDLSRIKIALYTGEVASAHAIAGIARLAFEKPILLNQLSFHAPELDAKHVFQPDPTCCNPMPIGCCVCGTTDVPCPILVCVDPASMVKTTITQ